jgi:hypothetical protein
MTLRDAVFSGRISRLAVFGTDCSLTGDAALQLILDLRTFSLFEWIGATGGEEGDCDQEEDRQALHLLILESEGCNASVVAVLVINRRLA